MKILFIVLAFGLAGCVTPLQYSHPTKTQKDFEKDKYFCDRQVAQYIRDANLDPLFVLRNEIKKCMHLDKGWDVKD